MKNRITFLVIIISISIISIIPSCTQNENKFSKRELEIILSGGVDSLMPLYTVDNATDTVILRKKSTDIDIKTLQSNEYQHLIKRMEFTVKNPLNEGVGIAAPQVGINKRIVIVQRLDKEGEPYEVYTNIKIDEYCGVRKRGSEGCLSVPDKRGLVERNDTIIISYLNPTTLDRNTETITGFTAIIFQHEVDHLEGVLYTDLDIM